MINNLEAEGKRKDTDLLNCANMLQEHKATIAQLGKKVEELETREADLQKLQTQHLQLEMDHRSLKRDYDRSNHKVKFLFFFNFSIVSLKTLRNDTSRRRR